MELDFARIIEQIPSGLFVLTSAYNGARSGALVQWVQRCAANPPLVMAAVATGLAVVPLIRDSHRFALCQVGEDDRFLARKFSTAPLYGEDPFVSVPTTSSPGGAPIVHRAISWIECEVVRHIDLESDYGLYVGVVRHGGMLNGESL